jgi:hypothetical protein
MTNRSRLAVLGMCLLAVTGLFFFMRPASAAPASPPPLFVRGFVVAAVSRSDANKNSRAQEIHLPGAKAFLVHARTNKPITSGVTDLSGRFTFKVLTPGTYRVCAEAEGFDRRCLEKLLSLGSKPEYVGNVALSPRKAGRDSATVFGKVLLRDGKRGRMLQPLLGLNTFGRVELETEAGPRHRAFVNNHGEYVVPSVPTRTPFLLRAVIDGAKTEQRVDPRTRLLPGGAFQINLVLENTSPELAPLVPLDQNGKRVELVRPGGSVKLVARAEDRDGDKLRYLWLVPGGSGQLSATDQPEVTWKLPGANGRYSVTVVVSDGKGGYAESFFSLSVSTGGVRFSGTVLDQQEKAVGGAQVEVNGRLINTGATGRFQLEVPPAERYVMNIRKAGFGLASQIHPKGVTAGTWRLRRAQVTTVDPNQLITLVQRRTTEDCPGPRASRLKWADSLKPGVIQWQDGKGNALSLAELSKREPRQAQEALRLMGHVDPALTRFTANLLGVNPKEFPAETQRRTCGPGISVEIPPQSLVDQNGKAPAGKVELALSTVDLGTPGQMPGDFSSVDSSGNSKVMESFGAGSIDISAGASRFNLKPGATATVSIPVDPGQLASGVSLPPQIPLLTYDERRGIWVEDGQLDLVGSGANRAYAAKVKRFSSKNADLQFSNPSCVAVRSGPGLPAAYTIEVTMPSKVPGAAPVVVSFPIDNSSSSEHVIYNLSNNANIVLVPIVPGVLPNGATGDVPAGVFVVNTGAPQISPSNLPPGPPYYNEDASGNPIGPCLTRVDLSNLALPSAPDAPDEFLQGLDEQATDLDELANGSALKTAIQGASDAYYGLIDPRGQRRDLIDFKSRNRFGQPLDAANGELETSAVYANSGDLGFGRHMNCRRNRADDGQLDIACYVTNYGDLNTPDLQDATNAAAQNAAAEVATVAMEYSRVENPPAEALEFPDNTRTVKFYVYKKAVLSPTHAGQGNGRDISANLDFAGERPVPQLCMVCHGGAYSSVPADPADPLGLKKPAFELRGDVFMGSRFLPFDLHYFVSPDPPHPSISAQQPAFRSLNLDFVKLAPPAAVGDPVIELIDAMYPGNPAAALQVDDAVVPNWDAANPASADHRFYRDVFARACRTCHVTSPFGNIVMNDKNQFRALIANVQTRVCDEHVMPHARRTHDLFWTSVGPNMAAQLQVYGQSIAGWDPTTPDAQCGLSYTAGGNVSVSTFTQKIQPIFSGRCTLCHAVATAGNANLSLASGSSYGSFFSGATPVVSTEHPPTPRVHAAQSSDSYLYRKLDGTHGTLPLPFVPPGPGGLMPADGSGSLSATDDNGDGTNDLEELRIWIDTLGAPGP